jgi:hypothetical protein
MGIFRICAWYLPLDHKEKENIGKKKGEKQKQDVPGTCR